MIRHMGSQVNNAARRNAYGVAVGKYWLKSPKVAACPWQVISAEAGIFPGWEFLNVLSGLCILDVFSWSWFILPIYMCNASYHTHHFSLSSPSWESSVPQQNWLETSPHASFPEEFNQLSRKDWKPKATNKLSFILIKGTLNVSAAFLLFPSFYIFAPPHLRCMWRVRLKSAYVRHWMLLKIDMSLRCFGVCDKGFL